MPKEAMIPCIICGKTLQNVMEDSINQPYEGTAFTTPGHYGSTVFDPMNGEFLEVNFCDECLKKAATEGRVITKRSKRPVHHDGIFIGWALGKREYVPWTPDTEPLKDFLEIESWEEWENLRESQKLESWLPEESLREILSDPDYARHALGLDQDPGKETRGSL